MDAAELFAAFVFQIKGLHSGAQPGAPAVTAEGDGGLKYAGREMSQRSPPHAMCVGRPQRCLRWGDCRWMPQRRQACHQRRVCPPAGRCPSQCAWPSFRAVQSVELTCRQARGRWAAIKPCRPRGRFGVADRAAVVALPTCLGLARSAGVCCRDATACSSFFVGMQGREDHLHAVVEGDELHLPACVLAAVLAVVGDSAAGSNDSAERLRGDGQQVTGCRVLAATPRSASARSSLSLGRPARLKTRQPCHGGSLGLQSQAGAVLGAAAVSQTSPR